MLPTARFAVFLFDRTRRSHDGQHAIWLSGVERKLSVMSRPEHTSATLGGASTSMPQSSKHPRGAASGIEGWPVKSPSFERCSSASRRASRRPVPPGSRGSPRYRRAWGFASPPGRSASPFPAPPYTGLAVKGERPVRPGNDSESYSGLRYVPRHTMACCRKRWRAGCAPGRRRCWAHDMRTV